MEIRIKTGKLTIYLYLILMRLVAITNLAKWVIVEKLLTTTYSTYQKSPTKCRRTANNDQPQYTCAYKSIIGKWTLGNQKPNSNGPHLTETCDQNDHVCCNNSPIRKKDKSKLPAGYNYNGGISKQIDFSRYNRNVETGY